MENKMKTLNKHEIQLVSGGMVTQAGYSVGYAIGYVFSGQAGRDLGNWLYDGLN